MDANTMTKSDTKELKMIEKAAREFARKVLAPEREENDHFPFGPFFSHVLDKAFELDFFHLTLPETMGGMGQGVRALCTVMDQICQEDSSLGGIIFTNAFAQSVILGSGSDDKLKEIVDGAKTATDFLIAFPILANPGDMRDLPKAQAAEGGYALSGKLDYLVLGGLAGHAVIPARIDGKGDYDFFLIDLSSPDITKSEPVMSHGLHACPAVDVSFSSTRGSLLGEAGNGDICFSRISESMQLVAASMLLGIMRGSYNEAFTYCSNRVQGGRKLKDWSAMQMMLADMLIQVQVASMLVERACQATENQEKDWPTLVKAASLHIQATSTQLATDGIQAMGGVGYMKDFGQEKRFRDSGQIQTMLGHVHIKKLRFIRQFFK